MTKEVASIKDNIRSLLNSNISNYRINKDTGVAQSTLSDLKNGKSKLEDVKLEVALKLNDYYTKNKFKTGSVRSVDDIEFGGIILSPYTGVTSLGNNIYTAHYSKDYDHPSDPLSNRYKATWDLSDFFENESTFEWGFPHRFIKLGNINDNRDKDEIELHLENIKKFEPYNKTLDVDGVEVEILHKPYDLYHDRMDVIYNAIAKDKDGNYYRLLWNVINLYTPVSFELIADYSRQCKHCLKPWLNDDSDCVDGKEHEYITN